MGLEVDASFWVCAFLMPGAGDANSSRKDLNYKTNCSGLQDEQGP